MSTLSQQRDGPEKPPAASCYSQSLDDRDYLIIVEDDTSAWIASTLSIPQGDVL